MKDTIVIVNGIEYVPKSEPNPEQPKPLLAEAKVGDLVRTDKNEWLQITRLALPQYEDNCLKTNDNSIWFVDCGEENTFPMSRNIVECQPLAPEGTAEWYRQMMLIGKKLTNTRWKTTKNLKYTFVENGIVKCNPEYKDNTEYHVSEILSPHTLKDGWQIYTEPAKQVPANGFYSVTTVDPIPMILEMHNGKWIYPDGTLREFESVADIVGYVPAEKPAEQPNPKFANVKVGDWVEVFALEEFNQCRVVGVHKNMFTIDISSFSCHFGKKNNWVNVTYDGINADEVGFGNVRVNITRILDPSEVVLDFGSFKGRVGTSYHTDGTIDDDSFVVFYNDNDNYIDMEYAALLDPATAELVRELVKEQEK